jgi:formylglycine-generating enzyme required for sulfatase activity
MQNSELRIQNTEYRIAARPDRLDPGSPPGDTADEEAINNREGDTTMKWSIGLILGLGLSLVFGASVSQGGWMMRIHQGATVEERALADVDSLTFYDATGSCCALDGTCTVTTQTVCSGVWTLHGVCTPNPCPGPTGACCNTTSGACTITTQGACTFTWLGAGVACNAVTCPVPPPTGMVLIPAGTFMMGSPTSEPGRVTNETQHEVTLTHAMYVSTYEVTQSEWQSVMGWNESGIQGAAKPVETLTWYDAVSYCNQRSTLDGYTSVYTIAGATYSGNHITNATVTWNQAANGYRLLTEAEWEYAARATSTTAFCNGGITVSGYVCTPLDPNLDQVGWYCGNSPSTTQDVGGKAANAWGLKDMHGNVWEWCWDLWGTYPTGPLADPTGPASGSYRVYRGGGGGDFARYCRSAFRSYYNPDGSINDLGLRLSMTAP